LPPWFVGEVFKKFEVFKADFERLKTLFHEIYEIRILGGEPLLHPEVLKYCEFIRSLYPNTNISLFTNGILLADMPDDFWEACSQNDILIKITHYPIELKLTQIRKTAKDKNVKLKIPKQVRTFFKHLNIKGDSDQKASFYNCRLMFKTPQLNDGKIFSCFFPAYVHIFNQYYNYDLTPVAEDYIDIYSDTASDEIITFLNHPIPMCRWCLTRRKRVPWGLSEKDINEWIGEEEALVPHLYHKATFAAIHFYQKSKQTIID